MKQKTILLAITLWACVSAFAYAQATPGRDPVAEALISPDIVMAHQEALGLSDAQRKTIQADRRARSNALVVCNGNWPRPRRSLLACSSKVRSIRATRLRLLMPYSPWNAR